MRILTPDEIATLLKVPDGPKDHYIDYDTSHWPESFECSICGYCETPEACVWSVECSRCNSGIGEHCKAPDGRITGLHQERHDLALINAKVFSKTSVNT